jgi:2,5-diketo-D-gluconate reductase B
MIHISVGDARVPALGFGTSHMKEEVAREGVSHALSIGYRHIDTAALYENEHEVGKGIRDSGVPRGEIWLTTKVPPGSLRREDVLSSARQSLSRLATDYVDLLLVHWPDQSVPLAETLGAMAEIRQQGGARYLGVSNFTVSLLEEALAIDPQLITNQVEYHPLLSQEAMLTMCRQRGLFLTAYSPLAMGRVFHSEALTEVAAVHGRSVAQVALRWLVQQDRVAAIPKAASPKHREANLEIFDFELSEEDMARVSGAASGERIIDPHWAPDWDD